MDRYHRNLLFSRLVELRKENSSTWTKIMIMFILIALAMACYGLIKRMYISLVAAALILLIGILTKILGPKLNKYAPQRREARER